MDSFDLLTQLAKLPNLQELQLDGNPIAADPEVRLRVRSALPQLLTYNRQPVFPPQSIPVAQPASSSTAATHGFAVNAASRFEMGKLMEGSTRVVEARDTSTSSTCAIKVYGASDMQRGAREVEFENACVVSWQDPTCALTFGRVTGHFVSDEGHMCIVMPQYGLSTRQWVNTHGPLYHRVLSRVVFYAP